MFKIKEIRMTLTLEDSILPLQFQGRDTVSGKECFQFVEEEKKVTASVMLEEIHNITAGFVTVKIENHPFRESYNLAEKAPIKLAIQFEEPPTRMCAAYQHRDWWSRPAFVNTFEEMPERTQALFLQGEKNYGFLLPMVGDKTKTYITKGTKETLSMELTAYTTGINSVQDYSFLLSDGPDFYELTERVMKAACRIKKIPSKAERKLPEMFEYFGWCSWDAFYTDITEEKVLGKVRELKEKHVPARWILMDDGWLSTENQCLTDFKPDFKKFPKEFKGLTEEIKHSSGIDWIGVWHALGGYWGGIGPDSKLAIENKEYLYQTKNGKLLPHFEPEKGFGFWRAWYTYLRNQGIDFVKVDGQSALKNYYKNNEEIAKVAAGTHQALEGAVTLLMNGNIINCMGMAMENILNRPTTCISRNSDDFVPGEENGFREHMLQNSYNALYHDALYVCDWDMYWTNHPDAGKHALVRAISGGPIYVSDRIGETICEEIMPLVYHDGRILRMDRCAKPSLDCIFTSPLEQQALKLTNTVNQTGAVAAFHIGENDTDIIAKIAPSDVYDLEGEVFGAYHYFDKTFTKVNRKDLISIKLAPKEYTLVLFIPMKRQVTPIGLINKYMSTHAVKSVQETEEKSVITLKEGGIFGFYKEDAPKHIEINGQNRSSSVRKENGYYTLDCSDLLEEIVITIE
jgi:raffinose synthase